MLIWCGQVDHGSVLCREPESGTVLAQGYVLTSEIDGTIQMKSYLTGNPEIKVGLNEDLAVGVRSSSNSFG
jgi:AP-4 complex subunit mu-1